MENLSNDLIENIFCRVPAESILKSQRVCKTWRNRLRHVYPKLGLLFLCGDVVPSLYYNQNMRLDYVDENDHYRHIYNLDNQRNYRLAENDTIVVGSCNGWVCLKEYPEDPTFICNPITGESVSLPSINQEAEWKRLVGGFGYLPSTNEYKVVRIKFEASSEGGHAEVYTLGCPRIGWRKIGNVPYIFWSSGIFANGALHWVDNRYNNKYPRNMNNLLEPVIVAFDLENEIFELIPSPAIDYSSTGQSSNYCIKLLCLRGNLCVVHFQAKFLDIWSFKKESIDSTSCETTEEHKKCYYDCTWSWRKEFTLPCKFMERYEPFDIAFNNKVLLWRNKRDLYSYDPKTSTLTKVMEVKDLLYHQTVPHMNSLVSLKDLKPYQLDAYENYISDRRWRL